MIGRRRVLFGCAVAGLSLSQGLAVSAASPAVAQTVLSLSGRVAYGVAVAPLPSQTVFEATLVDPGVALGASPAGGVDYSRPWAQLREETPTGSGDVCETVTNPTSWSMSLGERGSASFDATCNDGSGFQFYRISWVPAESLSMGGWFGLPDAAFEHQQWGAPGVSKASGELAFETGVNYWDVLQVCGWNATAERFRCGSSWSPVSGAAGPGVAGQANIWPAALLLSTVTSQS